MKREDVFYVRELPGYPAMLYPVQCIQYPRVAANWQQFGAGPAGLPTEALQIGAAALLTYQETGL
jgi:hypothetical protein